MATKDKNYDVELHLQLPRKEEEPTATPPVEEQFPMVVADDVNEHDATVRKYEMNEFNGTAQDSLIEMNEEGEIESMVKPIIEGQEPVMRAKDDLGIELNPTIGMLMEHFVDMGMKLEKDPTLSGQVKNIFSFPGQAIENALRNSLKFFAENLLPEDVQNKFSLVVEDFEKAGLIEQEGQFLGGPIGVLGDEEDFEKRRLFSPEENQWWEDLGVGIATFTTGLKGIQMLTNTKKLLLPSMAADGLVFDPSDGSLFTLLQGLDLEPGAMQDVIDFMDSTQHDQNMGRAIQVAEGVLIGGFLGTVGIAVKNREKVKSFLKKVFTPGSVGRKAADPAIKKVAELLTEVKSKWPGKTQSFSKYAQANGWHSPAYFKSFYSKVKAVRTLSGELVFPEPGKTHPKGWVKIRTPEGAEEWIPDHKWEPDPDQPNFGLPPQPAPLPKGHYLLKFTDKIKTKVREKLRTKLVNDLLKNAKRVQGRKPKAFIKAGGAASGKGTVDNLLRKEGHIGKGAVEINADTFKEQLPEYREFIDAGDARGANYLHEESSQLAKRAKDAVIEKNADVVFDKVLGNPKKAKALIKELKAAGYEIELLGVSVDPREAIIRSVVRYTQKQRWVHIPALLEGHKNVSKHFDEYVDLVDDVRLYDSNPKEPQLILSKESGTVEIVDEKSYNEFRKKGGINEKAKTLREILPETDPQTASDTGRYRQDIEGPGLVGSGQTPRSGSEGPQRTPPLADVTSSPQFKAWFKGSKIVDEQGKPLVVYHGTSDSIQAFDLDHPNRRDHGWLGDGVYLTDEPGLASSYSLIKRGSGDPNIMPLYVSLKKPYMATPYDKRELSEASPEHIRAWTEDLKSRGYDGVVMEYGHLPGEKVVKQPKKGMAPVNLAPDASLKERTAMELPPGYTRIPREIVVFNPSQVKSVFNRGTFDPTNPNIMAGALAVPAVYDPDQEPEFQQAGLLGSALRSLFKRKPTPGRTVAPEQPRPAYGEATTLFRDAQPKDTPLTIEPDTAEFLSRQDDVDFKSIDLYGKHGRVNFGTIENTEQFGEGFRKWLVRTMELDDATPESITFDEIIEKAEKLKWGAEDVMKLRPQDWDNSAPMLKVKDVWLQVAAHAHEITKRAAAGDPEVTEQMFKTAMQNFALINRQKQGLQASIARSQRAQAIPIPSAGGIEEFAQKLMTEAPELPGNLSMQQMAKTILLAGDDAPPEAWGDLAEEIPGLQEIFFAHMYPFMLSSFRTHAANWLSNGFVTTDYLGTQGFAAMASPIRRIFKNTEDRKTAREFLHNLQVMKQLIPEAFAVARKSYNAAPEKIKMGKLERKTMPSQIVNGPTIQKFFQNLHNNPAMKDKWFQRFILPKDLKQGGAWARIFDRWGKILDYPGKMLHSADDFAKTFSRGLGELDWAYRKAGKLVEEGIITEKESYEVVQQLLKDRPPRMQQAGETLAEFNTFQNDLGAIGEWVQAGREKIANWGWGIPWGHMVLAFIKTPVNIQKYNFHLMNLTKKSRDDIMGRNGGAKQDEALGRWAVASLYVTSASGLTTNFFSDNVTLHGYGSYGAEVKTEGRESQRAQRMVEMNVGIKPCSIGITDNKGTVHSYSFNTIEPLSTYMCATADIARNWHDIVADVGEGEAMKVMATLYEIGANNLINKNFAKNFHELMTVLMDPNQALRSPRVADNLVTMMIPRIVKDINTSLTETQHREFQHAMDGFMGMWEVFASNIPGLSRNLTGKVNYWNEPINNYGSWGPDFLSPFRYSKATPDAVDKEMYRLLMPMRDLPRQLEGVKMHPQVRNRWYYLMNNYEGRSSGLKMKQAVSNMIDPSNDRYHGRLDRKYPGDPARADEDRIALIKDLLSTYKGEAKNQLLAGMNDIAKRDPIVMKYQPDLYEKIAAKKAQEKETTEALDPDKMDMRSERDWQYYYKNLQQQPSLGFK